MSETAKILRALSKRIGELDSPNREIDGLICEALGSLSNHIQLIRHGHFMKLKVDRWTLNPGSGAWHPICRDDMISERIVWAQSYTSSISAIVLVEDILSVNRHSLEDAFYRAVASSGLRPCVGSGKTEIMARRAAALNALAERLDRGERIYLL